MKILVTGSSGFLGSHTVKHLESAGHDVTSVDIVPAPATKITKDLRAYLANCNEKFDLLVHYAAEVGGRANIENNYLNMIANIDLDRVVFDWAIQHTQHIIYPSSSAVYPVNFQTVPGIALKESMIDFENNCIGLSDHLYGWCKLSAERMLWQIHLATDLQIHILRPFSGYGPGQAQTYPMANLVNIVKTQPDQLEVWGTGEQTRDWVHITDILRTVEWCAHDSAKYTTVNIGTGIATTFKELVQTIYQAVHGSSAPEITTLPHMPTGVQHRVADTALQRSLNILPRTTLIQGIQTML